MKNDIDVERIVSLNRLYLKRILRSILATSNGDFLNKIRGQNRYRESLHNK